MNKGELNKAMKIIIDNEDDLTAKEQVDELIKNLQNEDDNQKIIEVFRIKKLKKYTHTNELSAYNLLANNQYEKFIEICKNIIAEEPKHLKANLLLSITYRTIGEIDLAYRVAKLLVEEYGDKDIIIENYNSITEIVKNIEEEDKAFRIAAENLLNENDFVIIKLPSFIEAFLNDNNYDKKNGTLEIANWKFSKMMRADSYLAINLKQQWIQKKYITDTKKRGEYSVKITKSIHT